MSSPSSSASSASSASSEYSIRDVIYAEHYAQRIAMAVHEQILHFSKEITHQMLSAYPEGSAEYFVVIEALQRAGLGMLHQAAADQEDAIAPSPACKHEAGDPCVEPARPRPVIQGPWGGG